MESLTQAEVRAVEESASGVGSYLASLEPASRDGQELVRAAQAGDVAARERLIERSIPLVVSLARSYRVDGLDLADLIQEGCVGILRALARYDPDRGVPFEAYAAWWVRQALQELRSDFVRPLRLPPKALRQLARLKSEHARVYAAERREPSLGELGERLELDERSVVALARADARTRSLSEPLEDADGQLGVLGDLLDDPLSAQDYEDVLDALAARQLRALLARLTAREREIVDARFGLDGRPSESLREVGERLGLSAERVRQLEERALAKLRQAAA
ncbi:MAG: sigma-70 family RNA polymerase sigma factor [Thermoleophilia bacterium]|nr:sigma-70 family RNA polymerase sigma factor [Thermoleophilia bacterium]